MSSTAPAPSTLDYRNSVNYNEASMEQFVLFSDSLKDLKNLSKQLHSAAEYFELSYMNDDQKQTVFDTLKDYAINALVNTVDHLGSVTYKVTDVLDKTVDEISETQLRLTCIEQRLRTCQEYTDHEGVSQQCMMASAPMHHKRYILPGNHTVPQCSSWETLHETSIFKGYGFDHLNGWNHLRDAVGASMREIPVPNAMKEDLPSRPMESVHGSRYHRTFSSNGSIPKKEMERRTASPGKFQIPRSGSISGWSTSSTSSRSRPVTPSKSRPVTPSKSRPTSILRQRSDFRKSASMRVRAESERPKDAEQHIPKSKGIFKTLLGRKKTKKDDTLYTFLDEY